MKKVFILVISLFFFTYLTMCDRENINNNEIVENPEDEEPFVPGYPSTAQVLYDAVTDIDGNTYDAVRIGEQVWMAENLRTTRFANGEEIPVPSSSNDFFSSSQPRKYAPSNSVGCVSSYGYLYNWAAVMHNSAPSNENPSGVQGICPDGWHIPSDAEWTQLTEYVGTQSEFICSNSTNTAKALAYNGGWEYNSTLPCAVGYNTNSNNATGFSALPAGVAYQNNGADWKNFGKDANFWTSSDRKLYRNINCDAADVRSYYFNPPASEYPFTNTVAFSVRCVRD